MPVEFQTEIHLPPLVQASEIPSFCRSFLMPGFEPIYKGNNISGGYLSQEKKGVDFDICEYRLFIRQQTKLKVTTERPLVSLIYILKGNVAGVLAGYGPIHFREGYSYLLYVPAVIEHDTIFIPDEYRVVHVNLYSSSLEELSKRFKVLNALKELFTEEALKGMFQKSVLYSAVARGELQYILDAGEHSKYLNGAMLRKIMLLFKEYFKSSKTRRSNKTQASIIKYSSENQEKIADVKRIIDTWEGKPIELYELRKRGLLNAKVLKSGFKAMFGKTIYAYQLERRLERGCRLLLETNLSIEAIAREAGYDDHSSFSKMFKAQYKLSPREYRDKKRQYFPIKEMMKEDEKEKLIRSLEKGNVQSVTLDTPGKETKVFIEANPQFKTVNLYSSKMQHLGQEQRQELMQKPEINDQGKEQKQEKDKKQELDKEDQPGKKQSRGAKKQNPGEGDGLLPKKRTGNKKGLSV